MLDIHIADKDRISSKKLEELCFAFLLGRNYDGEIFSHEPSELSLSETAALYMLECGESIEKNAAEIRRKNSESYIVPLLLSISQLIEVVKPSVNPSGFIIKPPENEQVETLLDEIYSDYMRCHENEHLGIFRFKLKAREFSVPFDRIILFESSRKKIIIRTETQEYEYYGTLDSIMELVPDCFIKIHKSFIVNASHISEVDYGGMTVIFDDGSQAYISRTYKNSLKEKLAEKEAVQ